MSSKKSPVGLRRALPMIVLACAGAAACQPALIYGERTSLQIASVNLNDDVSEPFKVKVGFTRSLVTVAPPVEESVPPATSPVSQGEAVSVFSRFKATNDTKGAFLGVGDTLRIITNFASGQAAIAIADNTAAVAAIVGPRTVGRDAPEIGKMRDRLIVCVKNFDVTTASGRKALATIADELGTLVSEDSADSTRAGVVRYIDTATPDQLSNLSNSQNMRSCQ